MVSISNPLKNLDPKDVRRMLGGVLSSLTYWGERAASVFVSPYPAQLTDKLSPMLPTNGELISSVAPPGVLYVVAKTTKNDKINDLTVGSIMYSVPHLVKRVGVEVASTQGSPSAALAAARARAMAQANAMAQNARYTQTQTVQTQQVSTGIGKYKVA